MLEARNHVLAMLAAQIPLNTDEHDFMVKLNPAPAPWRLPGKTSWPERLALMLTPDIFAPPNKLEIIHAECTKDTPTGSAIFNIARGMEGTTKQQWPAGTHVTSVITQAVLDDIRGPWFGENGWRGVGEIWSSANPQRSYPRWLNQADNAAGYPDSRMKLTADGIVHMQVYMRAPKRKNSSSTTDDYWSYIYLPDGFEPPQPIHFFARAVGLFGNPVSPIALRIEGKRIILDSRYNEEMDVLFNLSYAL